MVHGGSPGRQRVRVGSVGFVIGVVSATVAAPALPATIPLSPPSAADARVGHSLTGAEAVAPCVLPVPGAHVMALASIPRERWQAGHRGIDIASAAGDEVVAPATGTVEYVGFVVDRPVITLRHAEGLRTSLEPVESPLSVGDAVERGAPVGTVSSASGHCTPNACVHWGMRNGDDYVDPLTCIPGFGTVVLLPLSGA